LYPTFPLVGICNPVLCLSFGFLIQQYQDIKFLSAFPYLISYLK